MEDLCLCSVILNQFLLNSKLKLGSHSSDISDVYNQGKDLEAPKRLSTGGPKPPVCCSFLDLTCKSCKSGQVLGGIQENQECSFSFGLPNFLQLVGICSMFLMFSHMSLYLRGGYISSGNVQIVCSLCIPNTPINQDSPVIIAENLNFLIFIEFFIFKV